MLLENKITDCSFDYIMKIYTLLYTYHGCQFSSSIIMLKMYVYLGYADMQTWRKFNAKLMKSGPIVSEYVSQNL